MNQVPAGWAERAHFQRDKCTRERYVLVRQIWLLVLLVPWLIQCTASPAVDSQPTQTLVPRATRTPRPTRILPTAKLPTDPLTKKLGPVRETQASDPFTAQLTITNIDWDSRTELQEPATGNSYLFVG